ncbi:sodium channel protein 60E-like, partial [Actinia tenebrosa]|uniref:Sodium channel protein n=1 Tax=Actinia tenebrosa TaxID=6105 RepID=A0A6P8IQN8_ACTTE
EYFLYTNYNNRYFEIFVIVIILVNCIFLALDHPPEQAEYVFAAIYTLEMFLKIIAKGFVLHSYAYLRDSWNLLDFFVVIMGYVTLAPNIANFSGIRTIRVLRALRTISAMKGLKAMVNTLLRSMKMLSDVLVLFLFFLAVMALIGLQLFIGELRNKCVRDKPINVNTKNWYLVDGAALICGNSSTSIPCPTNYTCLPHVGPNPDDGYTNFDNIGWALVMSFQLLTMDYWENLYDKIIAAVGAGYVPYFIAAIFFCSFYLLNLVLAVVALSYEQEIKAVVNESVQRRKEKKVAVSYPADEETLRTLRPIDNSVGALLRAIKAMRLEQEAQAKQRSHSLARKDSVLKSIGTKGTFKDVLDEKLKNYSFTQDMRKWPKFQRFLLKMIDHPSFELVVNAFILGNTVVLALYHHGIDEGFRQILDILNLGFTAIFFLEMVIKLMGVGFVDYLKSRWNLFDGFIVIMSLVDTTFELAKFRESAGTSIFRTFRLVRIMKLAQSWKTMGKLLATISNSVGPIGNITLILVLIIYIFAVLGVKMFGNTYTQQVFPDGIPRWNFKDFWHSFMVVFRILCGEWIEPLWDCMKATNPGAILFFIPAFVIGNFIVLNLFLALLLNAFDSEDDDDDNGSEESDDENNEPLLQMLKRKLTTTRQWVVPLKQEENLHATNGSAKNEVNTITDKKVSLTSRTKQPQMITSVVSEGGSTAAIDSTGELGTNNKKSAGLSTKKKRPEGEIVITECFPEFLMAPFDCLPWTCFWWLRLRGRVRWFVEHRYFEWFILSLVFISSLVLVFEDVHLKDKPRLAFILDTLNYIFAIIFAIEFVLKIIGIGVVEFFSSFWNFLDAFIVAISVACIVQDKNLSVFRSLRTVRALRPLRAVSRLEGMKVVVNALFAAIPGIANVLLVSLLFWLIFSILGVQLFAGTFFKCVDNDGNRLPVSETNNMTECLDKGYSWENSNINFDNVINGFLALFQVATFEGWMEVMNDAVDSRGVNLQPEDEYNFGAYTYFVIFIIIGAFFVLNLFVGVIIDNFNTLKRKYDEMSGMGMLLTDSQRKWVDMLKDAAKRKAPSQAMRPQDCLCGILFDIITGTAFEITLLGLIICNMLIMMFQHYNQSDEFSDVMKNFNRFFTAVFVIELLAKLMALRIYYFKKAWNIFDCIIVVFSCVGLYFDEVSAKDKAIGNPSLLRVIRIFRVARLLRLLEFAKGVRQLLVALVISLPALLNIGTLLFLVIFIFAIIGMSAFGHVKQQGSIDENVNFQTFGNSMMLLFRLSTGAGWNDILESLMVQPPICDLNFGEDLPNGDCGFPFGAIMYLVSYIIIVYLIVVNMYIAIILENVNRAQETADCIVNKDDIDAFYDKWETLVEGGKQYVSAHRLSDLVANLNDKFKIPQPNVQQLALLEIPIRIGERIHCFDLLKALVRRLLAQQGESPETFDQIAVRLEAQFKKSFNKKMLSPTGIKLESQDDAVACALHKATRLFERKRDTRREQLMMLREIDKRRAAAADFLNGNSIEDYESFLDDSDLDKESLSYHIMLKNKLFGSGYFDQKNRARFENSNRRYELTYSSYNGGESRNSRVFGSFRENSYSEYNGDAGYNCDSRTYESFREIDYNEYRTDGGEVLYHSSNGIYGSHSDYANEEDEPRYGNRIYGSPRESTCNDNSCNGGDVPYCSNGRIFGSRRESTDGDYNVDGGGGNWQITI